MLKKFILLGVVLMTFGHAGAIHAAQAKPARQESQLSGLGYAESMYTVDKPRVERLENGLTVLIKKDDRFPLVNVRLYVHAGSAYETPEQAGVSHLLEHMVFKGTEKRDPGATAMEIESVGGSLNAATSFDYTVYYCEVPDKEWSLGMDAVWDMAFHPAIDQNELNMERQVVLAELERSLDTPGSLLFRNLQSTMWKGTSYEWPILGYREVLENITPQDIKDYIEVHYQPQSMLLVVAGNIDPDEILDEARKTFGAEKNTHTLPQLSDPHPIKSNGPVITVVPGKWNKVYFNATFPIPDLGSSKIPGLELLAQLIGGDDTSLLYRKFKYDLGLVDDISTFAMTLERAGMIYISATLDIENVDKFWIKLVNTLANLSPELFTDREIERAKLNLADSLFVAKETLSGLASKLGMFQFFDNGQQAEANYLYDLSNVDRDQMTSLAREYIRPDRLYSTLLYPEDAEISAEEMKQIVSSAWKVNAGKTKKTESAAIEDSLEIDLPGGSRLVLLPDDTLPYTGLSIYWPGGDGELAADRQGLASVAAKVLTRGTEAMTATEIEDFLSDRASAIAAGAGRDTFSLTAKFPAWYSKDITGLVSDMLTGPTWPLKEIDIAKRDQIANIKTREDKPLGLAFRNIFPFLYDSAPYSYYHRGQITDIEQFKAEEIRAYWDQQSAQPFVLAVCGKFDKDELTAFASDLATELTRSDKKYQFVKPEWSQQKSTELTLPDRNQAHLLAVFPAMGTDNLEDSAGLTLLRAALAGQSGLLFRDLRDGQGLGYTVTAFLWQAPKTGFMAFYIGTEPDKVDQANQGFKNTVEMLQTTLLPPEEMERAKNILTGEYYQEHQTLLSRSRQAANLMTLGYDRNMESKLVELAQSLEAEDLRELARKYLDWDQAYFMIVAP